MFKEKSKIRHIPAHIFTGQHRYHFTTAQTANDASHAVTAIIMICIVQSRHEFELSARIQSVPVPRCCTRAGRRVVVTGLQQGVVTPDNRAMSVAVTLPGAECGTDIPHAPLHRCGPAENAPTLYCTYKCGMPIA